MNEKVKVRILEDGVTAKECNPLGDKPTIEKFCEGIVRPEQPEYEIAVESFYFAEERWQQAESSLRTFEIADMDLPFGDGQDYDEFDVRFAIMQLPIGSIHNAELLHNGKIKIID